jgi:hypothetical protein
MDRIILDRNLEIGAVLLAGTMLLAWRLGIWFGRRPRLTDDAKPSKFDEASIAPLSLLLAFTFGISISKHDQRRVAVVADSNAIGDFYTCATLLKDPIRTKLQATIREYAELRLQLAYGKVDDARLQASLPRFQQMHGQMTLLVQQAVSEGTPIAVTLTNMLNAVISNQASRLAAIRDRLPISVLLLLLVSAIISALLIGREQGVAGNSDIVGTMCFELLVSAAIYVTVDLNQPERGLIRVSQRPMEELLSSISR